MTNWVVCTSLFYRSCTPKIGGFIKTIINEHHYEHTNISWISHQRSVQMICNISLLVSPLDISTVIQARTVCVQCVWSESTDDSWAASGRTWTLKRNTCSYGRLFTSLAPNKESHELNVNPSQRSAFIRQRLSGFLTNRWLKWEVQPLAY